LAREESYAALQEHTRILQQEIDLIDQLVHGCYRAFADFDLFVSFAMFYFVAAHNSEDQRRRGRAGPGSAFLLADNAQFRRAIDTCYDRLMAITAAGQPSATQVREFRGLVARSIEPYNIAGLCDDSRQNMYPFIVCPAIVPASPDCSDPADILDRRENSRASNGPSRETTSSPSGICAMF